MIFARIGAVLMMLPGVGESYVPPRIRLSLDPAAVAVGVVYVAGVIHGGILWAVGRER